MFWIFILITMISATAFVHTIPLIHGRYKFSLLTQKTIYEFQTEDFAPDWPYAEENFRRLDNSNDAMFYQSSRFVLHMEERTIQSLTKFYRKELTALQRMNGRKLDVLDLCSSWVSHLPTNDNAGDNDNLSYGRIVGIGMNEEELLANSQLNEYYVHDLNQNPSLPYFEDHSMDVVCIVASVDYLTKPRQLFQEIYRILRPNGIAIISFSNRCFASKAIAMWLETDDIGRITIVASYFHYSSYTTESMWKSIVALDLSPPRLRPPVRPNLQDILTDPTQGWAWMNTVAAVNKANAADPLLVVKAVK
jgi:SAM-dependent methyltransferase